MMDRFEEIVKELGAIVNLPLHLDKQGRVRLNVNQLFSVQLEFEPDKERILIASFLCEMPPGKFRENLFKECLKTNFFVPTIGILGLSQRNNQLVLFDYLPIQKLTGQKLADFLTIFFQKADLWRTAVQTGVLTPITQVKSQNPSLFDLKP